MMEKAMSESSYSTSDLSRRSGDVIADALRHPVTITQRGKTRLVLMSVEDYRELRLRADPRRAARSEDIADSLLGEIEWALDRVEPDLEE
ncbi:MAG TPA: type II toxin-antitoxin system prevent-host-death family antitoxin [Rhizobiaceae bacterium]|nr:type II toxin-antitoxin system prevent-host-death family antitoxin [Rhizobiaceae bacterium]